MHPFPDGNSDPHGHRLAAAMQASLRTSCAAFACWVLGFALWNSAAKAEETASCSIGRVIVGLDGSAKLGQWTSLDVLVHAREAAASAWFLLESVDPDGEPTNYASDNFSLNPGPNRIQMRFQLGRLQNSLVLHLKSGDRTLDSRTLTVDSKENVTFHPPLRQSAKLVGVLGEASVALPLQSDRDERGQRAIAVAALTPETFPTDPLALESLDILLVTGIPSLSEPAMDAVRRWTLNGGRLVVSVGTDAEQFPGSAWANWFPLKIVGSTRPRELSGVESFAGKSKRIPIAGSIKGARIDPSGGEVRVTGLDGPILMRAAYGFGAVELFGLDLDRPPLSRWESRTELLRKLTGTSESGDASARSRSGQIAKIGLSDLATQLRSTHESFEGVRRSSLWSVLGLIAVSIVLIGPLDYFLVHRLLRRPQWTWATLPLMVATLSFAASRLAQSSNGSTSCANQLEVVDYDVETGTMRGRASVSLYSAATQRIGLLAHPETAHWRPTKGIVNEHNAVIAVEGLPEERFGGMYRESGMGLSRAGYDVLDGIQIEGLPISLWSTKTLAVEWDDSFTGLAESRLTSPQVGQLSGSIVHHLPAPLTDWVLAYGNRVYLPRERADNLPNAIGPNVSWTPARTDVYQRELLGFLTRTVATRVKNENSKLGDDIQVDQTDWDPFLDHPVDVFRMITFHEKADGRKYTGLFNDAFRRWELSPLLDLGRAVLFGCIKTPEGAVKVDVDQKTDRGGPLPTTRTTIVRIVLPVKRTGTVPAKLPSFSNNPTAPSTPRFPRDETPAEAEIPDTAAPSEPEPKSP